MKSPLPYLIVTLLLTACNQETTQQSPLEPAKTQTASQANQPKPNTSFTPETYFKQDKVDISKLSYHEQLDLANYLIMQKNTMSDDGNYKEFSKWLLRGNSYAMTIQGYHHFQRNEGKEAEKWLLSAAENDNPFAETHLGELYLLGSGQLAQDKQRAMYWFRRAAEHNHAFAAFALGAMHADIDFRKCELWHTTNPQQHEQEIKKNQCNTIIGQGKDIDDFHDKNITRLGAKADLEKAAHWFKRSIELGRPSSIFSQLPILQQQTAQQQTTPKPQTQTNINQPNQTDEKPLKPKSTTPQQKTKTPSKPKTTTPPNKPQNTPAKRKNTNKTDSIKYLF